MTLSVKHKFTSLKSDGADATLVRPSNWNDTHDILAQAKSIIANAAASAGPCSDVLLGQGLWFNGAGRLDTNFVGMIGLFISGNVTTGWLKANGAAISRTTYADLFAYIGTAYGAGDGSTTFNLPDFRGCFIRGWDDSRGTDPGRVLGTLQTSALGSHTHGVNDPTHNHGIADPGHAHGVGDPGHAHTIIGSTGTSGSGFVRVDGTANDNNKATAASGTGIYIGGAGTGIGVYGNSTGITIQAAGAAETRPVNYSAMICIKY